MPSVLGSALRVYALRNGQYASSASSTSWSALTDEEDDDSTHHILDVSDPYDTSSKSANPAYTLHPNHLSYARRPSGINNRSTVPHLQHRRLSSDSSSGQARGYPRSVPIMSRTTRDDEETLSDFGSISGDGFSIDDSELQSEKAWGIDVKQVYPAAIKPNRSRNRASLPACFSLLQMSFPMHSARASPVSSSSGNTIARQSPPTPKLPTGTGLSHVQTPSSILPQAAHTTPRGRRRDTDKSRSSRRSGPSSNSRSRSSRMTGLEKPRHFERSFQGAHDSSEELFDTSDVPRRGRAATRRNSSPPPHELFASVRRIVETDQFRTGSESPERTRGRTRVVDLGESRVSNDAPGYGNGRSGLVHRERVLGRVPL